MLQSLKVTSPGMVGLPFVAASQTTLIELAPSGDTSGATDYAAIQNAISALEGSVYPFQGGKLRLGAGAFFLNQMPTVTADNIMIEGAGFGNPTGNKNTNSNPQYGGTVIQPVASFSGSAVFKFGQSGTPARTLSGCFLRDLSIDGSALPASVHGVFWQVFKGGMERVYIYKATGDGIRLDGNGSTSFPNGCWDNHFWNVHVEQASGNGWGYTYATDNTMVGCTGKYCTGHGFYADANAPSNMWTGCYSYNNTGKGFQCDVAMEQKIVATRVQDCNGGIYLVGSNGQGAFVLVGNTLRNCSFTTDNTTDAINISSSGGSTSQGGVIDGCEFSVNQGNGNGTGPNFNRPRYLINIADGNVVTVSVGPYAFSGPVGGAGAFGTAAFKDLGTNTRIQAAVGESGQVEIKQSGNLRLFWRSGSPAGAVSAGPASVVLNTAGGAGTTAYVKESGTGNTGWTGVGSGGSGAIFGATVATKTGTYTLVGGDEVILADATTAGFTLTLPTAVGFASHYVLKAINTNSNLTTVATTSSQTIDGASTITLGALSSSALYNSVILISDGSNWRII